MPKSNSSAISRNIALCYIRQSFTRDQNDINSPERQKANLIAICERYGWTPEFHKDVEGHKSGTTEEKRPGWLAVKARLTDPDVIALVANDLSRLHRNVANQAALNQMLRKCSLVLVLASTNEVLDFSGENQNVQMLNTNMRGIVNEWYSLDISQKQRDSIKYRRSLGKHIGNPPFGTMLKGGFLVPSANGAWLQSDGSFIEGTPDLSPEPDAIWRSYYEAAERVLTLYADGVAGTRQLAERMRSEGWPFEDRHGKPRLFKRDDTRRIVDAWREYGGLGSDGRAKDHPAYSIHLEEIAFNPERAVFSIDLLKRVVAMLVKRAQRPLDRGIKKKDKVYILGGIVYCAHSERIAKEQNNPKLRSRLGSGTNDKPRYRHHDDRQCGCKPRSIPCDTIEADFEHLAKCLTVRPEKQDAIMRLAMEYDKAFQSQIDKESEAAKRQNAINLCQKRMKAIQHIYKRGEMEPEEYEIEIDTLMRELAYWQNYTTELEQATVELAMAMDAVNKFAYVWDDSHVEERQKIVRSVFQEIVYDLSEKRIVDFRLHPWAERFLILRANLDAKIPQDPRAELSNKMVSKAPPEGIEPPTFRLEGDSSIL